MTRPVPIRFRFSVPHAAAAGALLAVEVLIALFVHDGFVRPYVGDVLVVLLIHHTLLAAVDLPAPASASGVLAFAYAVEVAQYAGVGDLVDGHPILQTIVGTTFQWGDLIAYATGAVVALAPLPTNAGAEADPARCPRGTPWVGSASARRNTCRH